MEIYHTQKNQTVTFKKCRVRVYGQFQERRGNQNSRVKFIKSGGMPNYVAIYQFE